MTTESKSRSLRTLLTLSTLWSVLASVGATAFIAATLTGAITLTGHGTAAATGVLAAVFSAVIFGGLTMGAAEATKDPILMKKSGTTALAFLVTVVLGTSALFVMGISHTNAEKRSEAALPANPSEPTLEAVVAEAKGGGFEAVVLAEGEAPSFYRDGEYETMSVEATGSYGAWKGIESSQTKYDTLDTVAFADIVDEIGGQRCAAYDGEVDARICQPSGGSVVVRLD